MVREAWAKSQTFCFKRGENGRKRGQGSKSILKSSFTNSTRFLGLATILCGSQPHPLGSELCPLIYPFFMKSNRCVQLSSFISMFLAREYWGSKSLPSFHPVSVPFSPSWQCFRWYKILNNSVRILSVLQGFTPLDKKLLHRDFLESLFSIFCYFLDGWGDL